MKQELFFFSSSSLCLFFSCTLGFIIRDASLHHSPCSLREGRIIFSFTASFSSEFYFLAALSRRCTCVLFFFCLQRSFVTVANVSRMKLAFLVAQ